MHPAATVAHYVGLVPLVAWSVVRLRHPTPPLALAVAGAYAVSWAADWFAHWVNPLFVSTMYLVTQAGVLGLLLLPPRRAVAFILVLGVSALGSLAATEAQRPEWLVHSVAGVGVSASVWRRPDLGGLRWSLLATFGLGWLAWVAYWVTPGWWTWGAYQTCRALGAGLFVAALLRFRRPSPSVETAHATL